MANASRGLTRPGESGDSVPWDGRGAESQCWGGCPLARLMGRVLAGRESADRVMGEVRTVDVLTEATGIRGPFVGRTFGPMYLPVMFPSNEAFLGVFDADLELVRKVLPSDWLHPVRTRPGRAAVGVSGMYFPTHVRPDPAGGQSTCPAYGEVTIVVLCTPGRPAPPLLPLLEVPSRPGWQFHVFPVHVPVTTVQAWESGRMIGNAPKFVADMDFHLGTRSCVVTLDEGGERILRLEVRRGGWTQNEDGDLVFYTVQNEQLVRTCCRVVGTRQTRPGPGGGRLDLGEHPIADQLRALDVSSTPLAVRTYLRHSLTLPDGEAIGPARRYDGWLRGEEKEHGTLLVRYDDLPPIDVNSVVWDHGGDPALPYQTSAAS